jgi:hypothetical protein
VVTVPADEYAELLVADVLGSAFVEQASRAPELRAMGLLQGELDTLEIGRAAMIDRPMFYSAKERKVYAGDVPGLSGEAKQFALYRALTEALLDQNFDWTSKVEQLNASPATGVRALVEGDALSVASSLLPAGAQAQVVANQLTLVQQFGSSTNAPYLAAVAGRLGVITAPTYHGIRNNPAAADDLVTSRISSDAAVLDLVRGVSSQAVDLGIAGAESMGMTYWYYVLASRLDDQVAWLTATAWAGDATTVTVEPGGTCVTAVLAAFDEGGTAALLRGFEQWVAAGPIEARATAQVTEGNRVTVQSCDPGVAAVTIAGAMPIAFGGAVLERALSATIVPDPSAAVGAPVCLALQARFRNVPFTLPDDQSPLLGLAGGWNSPYVAANADLGPVCLAPPAAAAPVTP